jgi:L-ascorbate metabolism protein UlaG (beta-lactamase superfamily)
MLEGLHWFGHSSFRLDGAETVYFDPVGIPKDSPKAKFIFISHEHFDHYSAQDLKLISTKETVIITDKAVAKKIPGQKVDFKEIKALSPGESLEVAGVKIKAVPSYNINKSFHPKNSEKLGFIVLIDGSVIYFAGDTDYIPEMKDFRCDVAFLPVGGTFVMTPDEAAEAAQDIKPKLAIPMHYDQVMDAQKLQDLLNGKVAVKILRKERWSPSGL